MSAAERTLIAKQINGLSVDINATADAAKFNGSCHFLPTSASSLTFQVGEGTADTMSVALNFKLVNTAGLFGNADNTELGSGNDDIELLLLVLQLIQQF